MLLIDGPRFLCAAEIVFTVQYVELSFGCNVFSSEILNLGCRNWQWAMSLGFSLVFLRTYYQVLDCAEFDLFDGLAAQRGVAAPDCAAKL